MPGFQQSDAGAVFTRSSALGASAGSVGACGAWLDPAQDGVSAGNLTITDTTSPFTFGQNQIGNGIVYVQQGALGFPAFQPGETLRLDATGAGDIPAFEMSVTGPPLVTGFMHSTTPSSDLMVTWDPIPGDPMELRVQFLDEFGASGLLLLCDAGDLGSVTVPASTLGSIPSNLSMVDVELDRVRWTSKVVAGTTVELQAVTFQADAALATPL
jgi:hypothetical protein